MNTDVGGGASTGGVAQQIWIYLTSHGLKAAAAAGIMGNLGQESGLNSTSGVDIPGTGYGIAQWTTASRQSNLQRFALDNGENENNVNTQLGFLMQELDSGNYGNINTLNSLNPTQAAIYFEQNFENAGIPDMTNRINYANDYYLEFEQGGSGTGAPQGGTSTGGTEGTGSGSSTIGQGAFNFFQGIDNSMQIEGFQLTNPIGSLLQDSGAIAFRTFLFLVGLILIIFGMIMVVKQVA